MQDQTSEIQQSNINTAILRLTYGLEGMQKDLTSVKDQLGQFERGYVPSRENDLQLNVIRDSIHRMENDIDGMQKLLSKLEEMVRNQEAAARERDATQREALTKLINELRTDFNRWQLRMIIAVVSPIGIAVLGLIGQLFYNYFVNVH